MLASIAAGGAIALAPPADAQQYRIGGDPVIVDYSVLDSLGPPVPDATSVPPQPTIRRVQPLPPGFGSTVQLRPPPSKPPRSTLTAEQPPEPPAAETTSDLTAELPSSDMFPSVEDETPTPPPPPSEIEPPPAPAIPESDTEAALAAEMEADQSDFEPPPEEEMDAGAELAETPPEPAAPAVEPPQPAEESPAETAAAPPAPEEPAAEPPPPETPPPEPVAEAPAETAPEPPAAEPAPAESETSQTAALPPAATADGQLRIAFPEGSAEIPEAARQTLDNLASQLNANESMRVQLLAYASGSSDAASRARRMSLSRALAVRAYLIAQGVRSTRMDVRALGNNVEGEPADRVDIIPQAQ